MWSYIHADELYHYGVKGMKWGVRRYQNKDGTLTPTGKSRYRTDKESDAALKSRVKGDDDVDGWAGLYKEIHEKSGHYYFGQASSPAFKKALDDYAAKEREIDKKYLGDLPQRSNQAANDWHNAWRKVKDRYKTEGDPYYDLDRQRDDLKNEILNKKRSILSNVKIREQYLAKARDIDAKASSAWRELATKISNDPEVKAADTKRRELNQALLKARTSSEYYKASREAKSAFEQKLAGVVLTDLGYQNTAVGRKFLLDNGLIFDD